MKNFFIVLAAVCVILLLVALLGGKKTRRKMLGFFVEEREKTPLRPAASSKKGRPRPAKVKKGGARRNPNQAYTEMAILQQKIDERRRIVDSTGHSTIYDEYFELVFETRRGETIHLVTSRPTFKEVPFNQEGALTHKKGMLIKFKYHGGLITDEPMSVNAK